MIERHKIVGKIDFFKDERAKYMRNYEKTLTPPLYNVSSSRNL